MKTILIAITMILGITIAHAEQDSQETSDTQDQCVIVFGSPPTMVCEPAQDTPQNDETMNDADPFMHHLEIMDD